MPRKSIQPKPEVAERQRQALEMRKAGLTYREIAERLGYASPGGARRASQAALLRNIPDEPKDERLLDLERFDQLLRAVWVSAVQGDATAIDRALKIMQSRERLMAERAAESWSDSRPARKVVQDDATDPVAKVYAILADVGVLPAGADDAGEAEVD